jgi:hypothetical protein
MVTVPSISVLGGSLLNYSVAMSQDVPFHGPGWHEEYFQLFAAGHAAGSGRQLPTWHLFSMCASVQVLPAYKSHDHGGVFAHGS